MDGNEEAGSTPSVGLVLRDIESLICDLCDGARLLQLAALGAANNSGNVMAPDTALLWGASRLSKDTNALLEFVNKASSRQRRAEA